MTSTGNKLSRHTEQSVVTKGRKPQSGSPNSPAAAFHWLGTRPVTNFTPILGTFHAWLGSKSSRLKDLVPNGSHTAIKPGTVPLIDHTHPSLHIVVGKPLARPRVWAADEILKPPTPSPASLPPTINWHRISWRTRKFFLPLATQQCAGCLHEESHGISSVAK